MRHIIILLKLFILFYYPNRFSYGVHSHEVGSYSSPLERADETRVRVTRESKQMRMPLTIIESNLNIVTPIACGSDSECQLHCINRCNIKTRSNSTGLCSRQQCLCGLNVFKGKTVETVKCVSDLECAPHCKARCSRRSNESTVPVCVFFGVGPKLPTTLGDCYCHVQNDKLPTVNLKNK